MDPLTVGPNSYAPFFAKLLPLLAEVPGSIAEFGVYEGASTRELAKYGRDVYAFDTFEGMPKEEFRADLDVDEPGKFRPRFSAQEFCKDLKNVCPIVGRFAETLGRMPKDLKFAFVMVDCDLYESHKQVLRWLPKHLSPGALIFFEDYENLPGAKRAIDEFCFEHVLEMRLPERLVCWRKGL